MRTVESLRERDSSFGLGATGCCTLGSVGSLKSPFQFRSPLVCDGRSNAGVSLGSNAPAVRAGRGEVAVCCGRAAIKTASRDQVG